MIKRVSTHDLPDSDRSEVWEAWNVSSLIGLCCRTPDGLGLGGEQLNLTVADLDLARVCAGAHRVSRGPATIESHPTEAIAVYVALRGKSTFATKGQDGSLAPGQALIIDADRPFGRTFSSSFTELVLKVPRTLFIERVGAVPPRTAKTSLDHRAAARSRVLLRSFSQGDASNPTAVDDMTLRTLALDLLSGLANGYPGDRLVLANAVIEQDLHQPNFTAGALSRTLDISERQMSRLFARDHNTFSRALTARRLARAQALLQGTEMTVADIARRCGYSSASYFIRVFGEALGASPQHWRRMPAERAVEVTD